MTRKRPATPAHAGYEIRVGSPTPFHVFRAGDATRSPVAAFRSLRAATDAYPCAIITEGAQRKARELGE